MAVGLFIMLAGIAIATLTPLTEKIINSGLITAGLVMVVIAFVQMIKQREGPVKDELTRKIADRAAAYSWVTTLLVLLIIYWLHYFGAVTFTVNAVIAITYVVMIASMIICQRVFWRQGDVR